MFLTEQQRRNYDMLRLTVAVLFYIGASFLAFANNVGIGQTKHMLEEIRANDQKFRMQVGQATELGDEAKVEALWLKQAELDTQNKKRIANMLENYGWPQKSHFGDAHFNASQTVWLVLQHAELAYQLKYKEVAHLAYLNGNLPSSMYAMLQDRIRVNQNKPQLFGSQIHTDPKTNRAAIMPIIDEKNVNQRRQRMGMESIEEYAKINGVSYSPSKSEIIFN